jgi:hypothetical protein
LRADVDVLEVVEGQRADVADGAGEAILVRNADRLAGILDHEQAVLAGDRHDRVHVGRRVAHVHGHDGASEGRDVALDAGGVEHQGFVDVGDHGNRADHHGGGGRGHPGVGGHDDFIAGSNACRGEGGGQGAGHAWP